MLRISASVGKDGKNHKKDTKLIQAFLNVYARSKKLPELTITGICSEDTVHSITQFQKDYIKSAKPDGRVDPGGRSFRGLKTVLDEAIKDKMSIVKPAEGIVTFESEGTEGGRYHSRVLHVPGSWSGLTIGRGYDMGMKSPNKIVKDLIKAGLNAKHATLLSKANGKKGEDAKQFIIDNDLLDFQITPIQQKLLFEISYLEESREAERICKRKPYEVEYGVCNWKELDSRIKQIVVDLKFRGDYKPGTAQYIQEHIANNDFIEFKKAMGNTTYWQNVPKDRFNRRVNFLKESGK